MHPTSFPWQKKSSLQSLCDNAYTSFPLLKSVIPNQHSQYEFPLHSQRKSDVHVQQGDPKKILIKWLTVGLGFTALKLLIVQDDPPNTYHSLAAALLLSSFFPKTLCYIPLKIGSLKWVQAERFPTIPKRTVIVDTCHKHSSPPITTILKLHPKENKCSWKLRKQSLFTFYQSKTVQYLLWFHKSLSFKYALAIYFRTIARRSHCFLSQSMFFKLETPIFSLLILYNLKNHLTACFEIYLQNLFCWGFWKFVLSKSRQMLS